MAAKPKGHVVVVDGSNLATEGRTLPSLRQLDEAVRAYAEEDPEAEIVVVVDASFEHRIDTSERAKLVDAELHGEVVSPPAGAIGRGDAFVLRIAERTGARVLSNDSFQEFHAEHPWLFDEGRLVGGKPVPGIGWIFTPRLPVRGPKSRQVTGKARRSAETLSPPVKAAELAKAAKKAAARKVPPLPPGVTPKVGDVWTALAAGNGHEPPEAAKRVTGKRAPKKAAEKPTAKRSAANKTPAEKVAAKKAPAKKVAAARAVAEKSADKKSAAKKAAKKAAETAVGRADGTAGGASEAAAPVALDAAGAPPPGSLAADGLHPAEPVAKRAPGTRAAATKARGKRANATAKKPPAKEAVRKSSGAGASEAAENVAAKAAPAKKAAGKKAAGKKAAGKKAAGGRAGPAASPDASGDEGTGSATPGDGARNGPTRTARADPAVRVAIDEAMAEVLAPPNPASEGKDGKKSGSKKAKEHEVKDAGKTKRRRRRAGGPPPAVNEPLAFITFVATFPLQSEVHGEVVSFTSHGAMVDVDLPAGGLLHCYIPLTGMGDPPPAKARQVLARGERRPFVLVGLDPPRRVAELALAGVPAVSGTAAAGAGAP